jgi:DNA gyrase subunit A
MDVVDEKAHLLSVTENGYGKRSEVAEYRYQGRGGSGVINLKVTEKNGPVVGIKSVTDADQLLLITERGQLIRIKVRDIRETGRAVQGVRVIQLEEGDRVVAVAKLAESDEGDEEPLAALRVTETTGLKSGVEPGTDFLGEEEDEDT